MKSLSHFYFSMRISISRNIIFLFLAHSLLSPRFIFLFFFLYLDFCFFTYLFNFINDFLFYLCFSFLLYSIFCNCLLIRCFFLDSILNFIHFFNRCSGILVHLFFWKLRFWLKCYLRLNYCWRLLLRGCLNYIYWG